MICLKGLAYTLVPVSMLGLLVGLALYLRLASGAIVLDQYSDMVMAAINADLHGFRSSVDHFEIGLTREGGVALELKGIRVKDPDGALVAVAPEAQVVLSAEALWSLKVAPSKIVLVEPKLLVFNTDQGLALSFSREDGSAPTRSRAAEPASTSPSDPIGRIDIARALADIAIKARREGVSATYLREIGIKDATLILDVDGQQSLWRLPDGVLKHESKEGLTTLDGQLRVESPRGPWSFLFHAAASETLDQVTVRGEVKNLVPAALKDQLAGLAPLAAIEAPLAGTVTLDLSSLGEVRHAAAELSLGKGVIGDTDLSIPFDEARAQLDYVRERRRFDIPSLSFVSKASRAILAGKLERVAAVTGAPAPWAIDLHLKDGVIALSHSGRETLPLRRLDVGARIGSGREPARLDQLIVEVPGGSAACAGLAASPGSGPSLACRFGPTSAQAARAFWPEAIAEPAREIVERGLKSGRIVSGALNLSPGADTSPARLSLELADVVFVPAKGVPAIEAAKALVTYDEPSLEITVPDATMTPEPGKRVQLRSGRFRVADLNRHPSLAEIDARLLAPVPAAFALASIEPTGLKLSSDPNLAGLEGKADGQLKLLLPLTDNLTAKQIQITGRIGVTEGSFRSGLGGYDVTGGTAAIDLKPDGLAAEGQLLIGGVPAKLSWQKAYALPRERQGPITLSAHLDPADRTQLKLDPNRLLGGDLDVTISLKPGDGTEPDAPPHVHADLTHADIAVDSLSWHKLPGQPAALDFDIAKSARGGSDLLNLRISGSDVAAEGSIYVDAKGRIREFRFPGVTLNLVSRLDIAGALRNDNVWEVKVGGQTYDGRNFFRSLFNVGQVKEGAQSAARDAAGLDLTADIANVLGFEETSLRMVHLTMSKRADRLTALSARGTLEGGKFLDARLEGKGGESRRLTATSDDAGRAFRLVGFYPNMRGGLMSLTVDLEGRGPAEKTGLLMVRRFDIVTDTVVANVLKVPEEGGGTRVPRPPSGQQVVHQVLEFDWMRMPFSVGFGQFVLNEGEFRGPLIGAVLRGKVDFRSERVDLGGTYIPLQGLLGAPGQIPGLGIILAGPKGEGVFGVTFAIVGSMKRPEVIVNPFSLIAPGIFREMFPSTNPNPKVIAPSRPGSPSGGGTGSIGEADAAIRSGSGVGGGPTQVGPNGWSATTREPVFSPSGH